MPRVRKPKPGEERVEENPKVKYEGGMEVGDPTPVAIPVRFLRTENIYDEVTRVVRQELSLQAQAQGFESFEEADDFDVGDDYDPSSAYELDQEQENFAYAEPTRDAGSSAATEETSGDGGDETTENQQRKREKSPGRKDGDKRDKRETRGTDDASEN